MLLYANEYGGHYPDKVEKLLTYEDIAPEAFVCPATSDTPAPVGSNPSLTAASSLTSGGHFSFVYVAAGLTNTAPANAVLAYEPMANHRTGANFLWGDGHVSFEPKAEAEKLIVQLQQQINPPNR
jgi:prepilin-type processing-associated H-X9-DG protein